MSDQSLRGALPPVVLELLRRFKEQKKADQRQFLLGIHELHRDLVLAADPQRERLDYDKAEILLRRSSGIEGGRARSCAKEPWTVAWIEEWVAAGEVLYDVGANVGAYSLIAAKHTRCQARVFAFEPGYANFNSLCENVYVNDCTASVSPIPIALSAETGTTVFRYRDLRAGAAVHTLGHDRAAKGEEAMWDQPVLTVRLDDMVRLFGLQPPTHLKLDVDGGELDVICGARESLTSSSFRSLMVELSEDDADAIVRELASLGLVQRQHFGKLNKAGMAMPVDYGLFTRAAG